MPYIKIAIDGPAGAGKSTVAKEVAKHLRILYVDTGAMYRAVAWLALENGISPLDEDGVVRCISVHELTFMPNAEGAIEVYAGGTCITSHLRSPAISDAVSVLSVYPQVREILTEWQRSLARQQSVVMDGRDIGTVVFPEADLKIFLTASLSERTRRRSEELSSRGYPIDDKKLRESISERDIRDSSRAVAPLRRAEDAIEIDSSGKTVVQVVEEILHLVRQVTHD